MKRIIYADNAATTRIDPTVLEAMAPFTKEEYANASQPYSFSRKAKAAIKNAREEIAKCINAKPSEIFFTSGGTESDNWAIKGCAFADESKRTTITSTIEHHAVLRSCQFIERLGYPVAYITPNSNGLITVEMLEQVIAGTTNLVSVATANNEIGTIQPIKKLAEIAHRNGAFFHTDAVQAIGHIPIDVNELNVDLLSASAHKFNGPKGIGFLYVREGTPILPLLNGGAQENSLRAGTENVASIVGMATALSMNCSQIQKSQNHSAKMVELICSILNDAEVDYIRNGYSNGLKGTLNLSFRGKDGEAILHRLDLRGILVSTVMDAIIDKFGKEVTVLANDMQSFRAIVNTAVGRVFYSWVFGFAGKVTIKSPEDVKKSYAIMVKQAAQALIE